MLHELLLALSGHPSSLLYPSADKLDDENLQDLLSPAETTLLRRLARDLGEKHRSIRERATRISSTHGSIICRAVSTAILSTHLARFQEKILEVERDILEESPNLVGAYNIVPLSGLVGAFDGWDRKLQWLWSLVQFIQSGPSGNELRQGGLSQRSCTADKILERLRDSTHTGYPDIEQIALHLTKIAEAAWLKQISAWVLYGRLPLGAADFFITEEKRTGRTDVPATDIYSVNASLVPAFVTLSTANSILFIGKSLNHIRDKRSLVVYGPSASISPELELLPSHLAHLSSLRSPISSSSLSAAISAIRLSLSKNALQKLLPLPRVLGLLRILKDFFLLERGEFAVALISAADERLASRRHRLIDRPNQPGLEGLCSVIIKDGEVSAILARTWNTLSSLQGSDDDDAVESLDLARELLRLSIKDVPDRDGTPTDSKSKVASGNQELSNSGFDAFLLPTPTTLNLHVPSPLHLVLSLSNVEIYSQIHTYLLAIRRGHLRLSQLFLLSVLRRDHPSPKPANHLNHKDRMDSLARMRERADLRSKNMRPIWAAIGSATFLLAELSAYLQGQVIRSSWKEFNAWVDPSSSSVAIPTAHDSHLHYSSSPAIAPNAGPESRIPPSTNSNTHHDPETISLAHAAYLSALTHHLLLRHAPFTRALHFLLKSIDHLCGLMQHMATVQKGLDLESDHGVVNAFTNYAIEEGNLLQELRAAGKELQAQIKGLVKVLRAVDRGRTGAGIANVISDEDTSGNANALGQGAELADVEERRFIPWKGWGVERLLLKLDWAREEDETW